MGVQSGRGGGRGCGGGTVSTKEAVLLLIWYGGKSNITEGTHRCERDRGDVSTFFSKCFLFPRCLQLSLLVVFMDTAEE